VHEADDGAAAGASLDEELEAMTVPSAASLPRYSRWFGGSQTVTVDSMTNPPMSVRTTPPTPGWTSLRPMNQESTPGPVAIAAHTCSGARRL